MINISMAPIWKETSFTCQFCPFSH